MKPRAKWLCVVVSLLVATGVRAQARASENQSAMAPAPSPAAPEVPRLIRFSGTLLDAQERPTSGPVGVTFALYARQTGGAALWVETQNVKPDGNGNYTVLLGSNSAAGVPAELFVSGEARWLGIQVGQQPEHERILLVSVPYALKAGDAETLGGLPASAFVTTGTGANTASAGGVAAATSSSSTALPAATTPKKASTPQPATPCTSVTSDGAAAVNSIALFTTACNIESSVMTQLSGNVGFGTTTPGMAVDVFGNNAGLRLSGTGTHQVTVTGATSGRLGQDANGFFFASDTNGKSVRFLTNNGTLNEWMRVTSAGNIGIGTTTPTAKLDVNGNLNLPTTASATVGVLSMGGAPFAHNFGPANAQNTFLGLNSGNFTMSGGANTGVGWGALNANTTGNTNSAFGAGALQLNTIGLRNSAFGFDALLSNTTGMQNSAFGKFALIANTTGSNNSAFGIATLNSNATGSGNAAFGASALSANTADNNSAFGSGALQANTTGMQNSAFGEFALSSNITGGGNTAVGFNALEFNTGNSNSALGAGALSANTTGNFNSAFGFQALVSNTTGLHNSAFGSGALQFNMTGGLNAAFGESALLSNRTGNTNSAFGYDALQHLGAGDSNIGIGYLAGTNLTTGTGNIYIGNLGGASTESNTIRIGDPAVQTATFVAGINGATSASGVAVLVNSSGQLGTTTSSRRFKHEIADMGAESDLLMKLRPVAFYYKPELDETQTRQYGLVAEEVAQVAPQLVVFDNDGAPQTVRYHFVNAMLLNEVQKQRALVEEQQQANEEQRSMIEKQQNTIARQQAEIQDLAARLAKLEALVALGPLGR